MRVELAKLLSVLAHELRGPLSVIQGYLRLMLKQRDASHAETPMIRAMLDATGRLAAVGRQASDVALWMSPAPATEAIALAALAEKAASLVPSGGATVHLDDFTGRVAVSTSNADALAAALAAMADLTARDMGGPVEIRANSAGDRQTITVQMLPVTPAATEAERMALPVHSSRPVTLAFDRGGFGLSLVLASYVLEAHGAEVRTGSTPGLEVELQKAGGAK